MTARRDEKAEQQRLAVDMWLNCEGSNREIAERFGVHHDSVGSWTGGYAATAGKPPPGRTDKNPWSAVRRLVLAWVRKRQEAGDHA